MEYMNAEGPSFIPFAHLHRRAANQSPVHHSNREESWMLKDKFGCMSNGHNSSLNEPSFQFHNQKKGILTILLPCTKILVVNSTACQLLNYSCDELCTMKLQNLIHDHHKHKLLTISEHHLDDSNEGACRKLVDFVCKDGDIILASVSFRKIDSPQKCLVVIEPVDRKTAMLTVDCNGKITNCDDEALAIFQCDSPEIIGSDIRKIIPNISLDCDVENRFELSKNQLLTGRNKSGIPFPLCLAISKCNTPNACFQIMVWVFSNLNGLIILNKDLRISNCNYQFMKLLFGAARDDVLNQKITNFIPAFPSDLSSANKSLDQNEYFSSLQENKSRRMSYIKVEEHETISDRTSMNIQFNSFVICDDNYHSWSKCVCDHKHSYKEGISKMRLSKSDYDIHVRSESNHDVTDAKSISSHEIEMERKDSQEMRNEIKNNSDEFTVRAEQKNGDRYFDYKHLGLKEGYFSGYGNHWDGSNINIYYKVKVISFGDKLFYCVWISRDPWEINEVTPNMPTTVTGSSSVISTSMDDSTTKNSSCTEDLTRNSSASILSQCDEVLTGGEYSEKYTNIEQIGKGAFGYVKMAFRHSDGLLVVTKFIKKHKINVQSWVFDSKYSTKIPLEISLLVNLKHPNIIEVLDVFHNDSFFQLVMKKHGAGMDLFEFIERKPKSDEKLNSYIFRQIISAVHYLDSIGILHRDIKDENVIINEKFDVKLIDFGSAAFRPPGKMFSVFYGTVEYCSPEVLQGNKYRGPELEIWALGVTLYVLTFGENPFYDVQETIKGKFSIPVVISPYLYDLLRKMLEKDVGSRITINKVATHPWITQPVDIDKYRFEDVIHCSLAEADPPRYITEFTFNKRYINDSSLDVDGDRTVASSTSFCSLQTTDNTETFDQYDENLQDFGGDFLGEDKSSTPLPTGSGKTRSDITKSAGALNNVCEGSSHAKSQICDHCTHKIVDKKRFSLDINILKRLSNSSKCSDSDSSFDQTREIESHDNFNEKLELELINDIDEMKLVPNEKGSESYLYDAESFTLNRVREKYENAQVGRMRSVSHETDGSNATAYPEFYDTSDSRSCDGDNSIIFWDAENERFRFSDDY